MSLSTDTRMCSPQTTVWSITGVRSTHYFSQARSMIHPVPSSSQYALLCGASTSATVTVTYFLLPPHLRQPRRLPYSPTRRSVPPHCTRRDPVAIRVLVGTTHSCVGSDLWSMMLRWRDVVGSRGPYGRRCGARVLCQPVFTWVVAAPMRTLATSIRSVYQAMLRW